MHMRRVCGHRMPLLLALVLLWVLSLAGPSSVAAQSPTAAPTAPSGMFLLSADRPPLLFRDISPCCGFEFEY